MGGKIRILYGVDCTRGLIDSLHVNFLAYSRHLINRRKPISFHSPPNNVELWTATISPKEYKILTIMSCFCPCVEGLSYCSDFSNSQKIKVNIISFLLKLELIYFYLLVSKTDD